MAKCPKCGGSLVISHPMGASTWQEDCTACGYTGGGTVYVDINEEMRRMAKDHQHNPDPNANAARIVAEATASKPEAAPDLEAAWAAWSSHIQKVDERGMALLRAAFEAGWEAGRQP